MMETANYEANDEITEQSPLLRIQFQENTARQQSIQNRYESNRNLQAEATLVDIGQCGADTPYVIGSACIIILVLIFSLITLQSFAWWRVSRRAGNWCIKFIFVLAIAIIIATAVFMFTNWNLRVFFVLSMLGQYLGLYSLTILLMYLRHNTAATMRSKVKCFLFALHLIYLACFILGLTDMVDIFGATCTARFVLPAVFYLKDGCFLLYFVFLFALNHNKYLIDWDHPGQTQLKKADEKDAIKESLNFSLRQEKFKDSKQRNITSLVPNINEENRTPQSLGSEFQISAEEQLFKQVAIQLFVVFVQENMEMNLCSAIVKIQQIHKYRFQTSRLMCYSTWCIVLSAISLAVVGLLARSSSIVCDTSSNSWTYEGCTMALLLGCMMLFDILNFALLPRIVFVKTKQQVESSWGKNMKSILGDYNKGLSLFNPKTFSDDESEIESSNIPQVIFELDQESKGTKKIESSQASIADTSGKLRTVSKNGANALERSKNPVAKTNHPISIRKRSPQQQTGQNGSVLPSRNKKQISTGSSSTQRGGQSWAAPIAKTMGRGRRPILTTQIVDTEAGDEEVEVQFDNLNTERCDTEEALMTSGRSHQASNRQKTSSGNHKLRIIEEEVSSTRNLYSQGDRNSRQSQRLDPARNIELKRNNQPQGQEQEADPRHSSAQNGEVKMTPKKQQASKILSEQEDEFMKARENSLDEPSSLAKVRFQQNNHDLPRQRIKIHRTLTGLPPKLPSSGETDQQSEEDYSQLQDVKVTPQPSKQKQNTFQDQEQAHQATDNSTGVNNRRNRYSKVKSDSSKITTPSQQTPPIVSELQNQLLQYQNMKEDKQLRSSLVSSLTIMPQPPQIVIVEAQADAEEERKTLEQRPEQDDHRIAILHDDTITDEHANKTEQLHDGYRGDKNNKPNYDNLSEVIPIDDKRHLMTFGPAVPRDEEPRTTPADQFNGRRNEDMMEDKMLGQQQSIKNNPQPVAVNTYLSPSPMQEEDCSKSSLSQASDWLGGGNNDDEQSDVSDNHYIQEIPHYKESQTTNNPIETPGIGSAESRGHSFPIPDAHLWPKIQYDKTLSQITISSKQNNEELKITNLEPFTPLNMVNRESEDNKGKSRTRPKPIITLNQQQIKNRKPFTEVKLRESQYTINESVHPVEEMAEKHGGKFDAWETHSEQEEAEMTRLERQNINCEVFFMKVEDHQDSPNLFPVSHDSSLHQRNKSNHPDIGVYSFDQGTPMSDEMLADPFNYNKHNIHVDMVLNEDFMAPRDIARNKTHQTNFQSNHHFDDKDQRKKQKNFENARKQSLSSVIQFFPKYQAPAGFGGKSDTHSFICGHGNDNSFISTVIPGLQGTPLMDEQDQGPFTQEYNSDPRRPEVMVFGQAANLVLNRRPKNYKRIVRSERQVKVVNFQIIPTLTSYVKREQDTKHQQRIMLVQAQHNKERRGSIAQNSAAAAGPGAYIMNQQRAVTTTTDTVNINSNVGYQATKKVDLRANTRIANGGQPVHNMYSATAIANSNKTQNRFVRNILKKQGTGQSRGQQKDMQKKKVQFRIGTGTRGQGHLDEIAENYQQEEEKAMMLATEAAEDATLSNTIKSQNMIYSTHQMHNMQMAMPGQNNREAELLRRIQEGPAMGGTDLTRQLINLEKQQKYRAQHVQPYAQKKPISDAAPIIEPYLGANVRNPYEEHNKAIEFDADSMVSASDIQMSYLETSRDHGMQNPYDFQQLGTSPSPLK